MSLASWAPHSSSESLAPGSGVWWPHLPSWQLERGFLCLPWGMWHRGPSLLSITELFVLSQPRTEPWGCSFLHSVPREQAGAGAGGNDAHRAEEWAPAPAWAPESQGHDS